MGSNGCGALVQLPFGVCPKVDDIVLLEALRGSRFDPVASSIAYRQFFEVDCAWVEPAQRWYPYQFYSRQAFEVP